MPAPTRRASAPTCRSSSTTPSRPWGSGRPSSSSTAATPSTRTIRTDATWPTLKVDALPHLQFSFNPGYNLGNQGGALSGSYATPYGSGHKSAEWSYSMAATKCLGTGEASPRLDLNLNWTHVTQTFTDAGVIWEIDPSTSLGLGVGAGIGEQSPALRVFFAVQHDVRLF